MSEKTYTRVEEAEAIIKKLCEIYPDELWAVKPENIVVLGVENKKRGKKCKTLATIRPFVGAEKAVMMMHNVKVAHVVEVYWDDWNGWKDPQKQWVLFHELLHVASEENKVVRHDCEDFRIVLKAAGVNWFNREDLPNLILQEKTKFDLELRPNMLEYLEENELNKDEEKKPKGKKNKKEEEVPDEDIPEDAAEGNNEEDV